MQPVERPLLLKLCSSPQGTMTAAQRQGERNYHPGELVPATGIYAVTHLSEIHQRPEHDAVLIRGEEFPPCRSCNSMVVYQIKIQCSHITHDFDFSGPGRLVMVKQPK